jgi:hypothetical protein
LDGVIFSNACQEALFHDSAYPNFSRDGWQLLMVILSFSIVLFCLTIISSCSFVSLLPCAIVQPGDQLLRTLASSAIRVKPMIKNRCSAEETKAKVTEKPKV